MRSGVGLAVLFALVACEQAVAPTDDAGCKAAEGCQTHGRCTFDINTKKCVVGSSADCQVSRICQKEGLCKKAGEVCAKE